MFEGVRGAQDGLVVFSPSISSKFLEFYEVAYKNLDIFQYTWRSQMSQIVKCPKVTVILSYWEASGEVSKLRYKCLLYFSSNGSYCRILGGLLTEIISNLYFTLSNIVGIGTPSKTAQRISYN